MRRLFSSLLAALALTASCHGDNPLRGLVKLGIAGAEQLTAHSKAAEEALNGLARASLHDSRIKTAHVNPSTASEDDSFAFHAPPKEMRDKAQSMYDQVGQDVRRERVLKLAYEQLGAEERLVDHYHSLSQGGEAKEVLGKLDDDIADMDKAFKERSSMGMRVGPVDETPGLIRAYQALERTHRMLQQAKPVDPAKYQIQASMLYNEVHEVEDGLFHTQVQLMSLQAVSRLRGLKEMQISIVNGLQRHHERAIADLRIKASELERDIDRYIRGAFDTGVSFLQSRSFGDLAREAAQRGFEAPGWGESWRRSIDSVYKEAERIRKSNQRPTNDQSS